MKRNCYVLSCGSLALVAIVLGGCSKKVTHPGTLETKVVEIPDDPDEKERRELYKEAERMIEINKRFVNGPTARQRKIALENIEDLEAWKDRLGIVVDGAC